MPRESGRVESPLDFVDVKMGTENDARFSRGNVLPLAAFPFGMTAFSIQTNSAGGDWFYSPRHKIFEGLRLTHCSSLTDGDYGQLVIMPQTGRLLTRADDRYSSFAEREFKPHYISGYLNRYRISYELAPTKRGGVFRFRFESREKRRRILLLGVSGETKFFDRGGTVCGYTTAGERRTETGLKEYFDIAVDCPYKLTETENGASLEVDADEVVLTLGTSFISYSLAQSARLTESPSFDLERAKKNCASVWEHFLNRVTVCAESPESRERLNKFYTCLYRVFLSARIFYEVRNHIAVHLNLQSGEVAEGVQYANMSLWEGARTTFPLLLLIAPDVYADICRAILNTHRDTQRLPRKPMPDDMSRAPGMPAEAVLADGLLKGLLTDGDEREVLRIICRSVDCDGEDFRKGRVGARLYLEKGYLPCDKIGGSVTETLEYCANDYSIAKVFEKCGRIDDATDAMNRSKAYKNLYDAESGYFRPRDGRGVFKAGFVPEAFGTDFAECSARQAVFDVRHDMLGLDEITGGKLLERADELFESPPVFDVALGFETPTESAMACGTFGQGAAVSPAALHIPYIYAEAGNAEKTQKLVERMADQAFTLESYPGNDAGSALSAWYVFSCMGLYPFCPSRGDYLVTKPLFEKIEIALCGGKRYVIDAKDLPTERVTYREIMKGNRRK